MTLKPRTFRKSFDLGQNRKDLRSSMETEKKRLPEWVNRETRSIAFGNIVESQSINRISEKRGSWTRPISHSPEICGLPYANGTSENVLKHLYRPVHNTDMNPIETVQAVPLTVTEDGSIEVGASRVSLESVLYQFKLGAAPEEIAQIYPSLQLADIYAVIAYYLNHREAIEDYLRQQEAEGNAVQARIESQAGYQDAMKELRERLMARWSAKQRQ